MPANQKTVTTITNKLDDLNVDELKQVRDYTDNRLAEQDPDHGQEAAGIEDILDSYDDAQLAELRDTINERLLDDTDNKLSSADVSADDEKKKYIAQHGSNPVAQERAQDVPEPVSDEVKDLQNQASAIEQHAKGPAADGSH